MNRVGLSKGVLKVSSHPTGSLHGRPLYDVWLTLTAFSELQKRTARGMAPDWVYGGLWHRMMGHKKVVVVRTIDPGGVGMLPLA